MVYAASSEACWQLMEDDNMRVSIKERMLVLERLGELGIGYEEAQALRDRDDEKVRELLDQFA